MAATGTGKAVVIGGGLAGLAAAYRLRSDGWNVTVIEKEKEIGGRCKTTETAGFLFDNAAQHFHDSYDSTLLAAIDTGLGGSFRVPKEEKGIFHHGFLAGFTPRSMNPSALLPWRAIGPAGIADVSTIVVSLVRKYHNYNIRFPDGWTSGDDQTAEEFLARRTSDRFRRAFAEPVSQYATGAGLSEISMSGFMVALRYTFGDRTGSFTGGMGSLPLALAARMKIVGGMEATDVVFERGRAVAVRARPAAGGRARSYKADLVVCALPAPGAKAVNGRLGRVAGRVIADTDYSPGIVVNLGFTGEVVGHAGPVLLPEVDGFSASWLCTNGSKASEHAPEGSSVITVIYSGRRAADLIGDSDNELVKSVTAEAGKVFGLAGRRPKSTRVDRHQLGRLVVSTGHARRVRELWEAGSGVKNLFLAGDWTCSPTVEGAVQSGLRAARTAGLRLPPHQG